MPQAQELNDLLTRLQEAAVNRDFQDISTAEGESPLTACHDNERDEQGEEAVNDCFERRPRNVALSGSVVVHSNQNEDFNSSQRPPDSVEEDPSYCGDEIGDFAFGNENAAAGAGVKRYFRDLSQSQRRFWADEPDTDDQSRSNVSPCDDGVEDNDAEDVPRQGKKGWPWGSAAHPHYDNLMPFASFDTMISNEKLLQNGNILDKDFREGNDCDVPNEVNPNYSVFDSGQRFYDHYSGSCADTRDYARKTAQGGKHRPISLVNKFRAKLFVG
jgi:hypothetical protein